jgi:hypothetical protein
MAMITFGVFFLLLVLVYPSACAVVTLYGALRKRNARKLDLNTACIEQIDRSIDRSKKTAFTLSIIVTFFVVAPFIALVVLFDLF